MVEIGGDPLGFQTTPPRSKPEICLIGLLDLFFYPTKERNNSLFLERKGHGMK